MTDTGLSAARDPGPGWEWRFWAIFGGQAASLIGSAMTQFVLIWWITDSTGSVSALALAGLVALLPQALLGPLGGTLADRYSRRLIMIVADLVSALCMLVLIALFLSARIELWHIYTMMFIRSAMQAFQQPAAAASTAMLVPVSFLPRAAGLNQTLMGIITIAAAPLGALAISVMPIGYALSIDVVTAVLGIVPLLIYAIPQARMRKDQRSSLWAEFREGVTLVRGDAVLWRVYLLLTAVVLVLMPSFTLVPLLVKEHFGGGPTEVAVIEGLGGAGMILGGIIVTALAPKRLVLWILWGFALSCFAFALAALMPGTMLWLAVVFWVVSSLAFILGNAPLTVLIQTRVPNHLQGRALSLMATMMGLAAPVGLAIATPVGEMIGIRWLFVAMGVVSGLVALAGFLSPVLLAKAVPPEPGRR
ncbi:MFS transporter [Gemmobacter sp. 24YEA27]|uniref:MFS transporter n=1 Tax=Gemmobacter sp. 24YEA27 TaxID=3040672 RepID=UPI0024B3C02A|nr:MFS transporter [Gemmobacter sp. 24YEA27]